MNIDHILATLNRHDVRFLLIGGVNFLLRHEPVLTFDVDLWIQDEPANRARCERALAALEAAWGEREDAWGPVTRQPPGWLERQALFCLTSPHGAIDVFRNVRGLSDWQTAWDRSVEGRTAAGVSYRGLSDQDMLTCQLSLEPAEQKLDRIRALRGRLAAP